MSIYFSVGWMLNMMILLAWQKQDLVKKQANEMLIKAVSIHADVSCVRLTAGRCG
jgi:hypothetical protein